NVVVAFYPADFSKGCTVEMKTLVKDEKLLAARETVVLAISVDPCDSHARFAKTLGMTFRVLADTDRAVTRAYDVFSPSDKGGFASRSVFLVDKEGKVRWLDRDLRVPPGTLEGTELLAQVEKLGGQQDPIVELAALP